MQEKLEKATLTDFIWGNNCNIQVNVHFEAKSSNFTTHLTLIHPVQ